MAVPGRRALFPKSAVVPRSLPSPGAIALGVRWAPVPAAVTYSGTLAARVSSADGCSIGVVGVQSPLLTGRRPHTPGQWPMSIVVGVQSPHLISAAGP